MTGIIFAIITVLAWGAWLAPSQKVQFANPQIKTMYVAFGNLLLATVVLFIAGAHQLTSSIFWLPFIGGIIWAISGQFAFTATSKLGMAKAFGTWAPLNILMGLVWGIILWNEWSDASATTIIWVIASVVILIAGIMFIVFSGSNNGKVAQTSKETLIGFFGAFMAGILWGTYYVPSAYFAKDINVSAYITAFPLAVGMFTGSFILALITKKTFALSSGAAYLRTLSTGLLWGIGNFSMLLMIGQIGQGKGATIAQLCVVVNAVIGIWYFKEPAPKSRAAKLIMIGVVLASIGGIILGNIK